MKNLYYNNLYL